MSSLKERVKSLQADTTNTDTALTTLEEALAEKVGDRPRFLTHTHAHARLPPCESRSHSGDETWVEKTEEVALAERRTAARTADNVRERRSILLLAV